MKKLKWAGLIFFAFLYAGHGLGQKINIGVVAGTGMGKLTIDNDERNNAENQSRLSAEFGFFIEKEIDAKWSFIFCMEYTFLQSRGWPAYRDPQRRNPFFGSTSMSTLSTESELSHRRNSIGYGAFPLSLRLRFEKYAIRMGLQPMLLNMGATQSRGVKSNLENIRNFDFGPRGGMDIWVGEHTNFFIDFYAGLLNAADNVNAFQRYNRQILFGLNYYLAQ